METTEQPRETSVKKERPVFGPKAKEKGGRMYDLTETADGFEAILPGGFDEQKGYLIGTYSERFATREEAEQAVTEAREWARIFFERTSLAKSFSKYFSRIDCTADGQFRVTLPGLVDTKTGYLVGTTSQTFATWDEARDFYLQSREQSERLAERPLLEMATGEREKIVFSEFAAFNPRVAPSDRAHDIPETIKSYLMGEGRLDGSRPSAKTYRETVREEGWERKLFSFVTSYLEKDGTATAEELRIEHLDALTPKQAMELATRLVIDLTKYKWSDVREPGKVPEADDEGTEADRRTALQLLKDGLAHHDDSAWEGNGICRNFASSVKAVFDALKASQTKYSRLNDTYCLYEADLEAFAPKRQEKNSSKINKEGHAWNTFVTVSREGAANATVIDATWAKRNLETKQIEGLDYTLTRMEPVVYAVGQNLRNDDPTKENQLTQLLTYYGMKIASEGRTPEEVPLAQMNEEQRSHYREVALNQFGSKYDLSQVSDDELVGLGQQFLAELARLQGRETEQKFFATRAVELLRQQGVPSDVPPELAASLGQVYERLGSEADITEIEILFHVAAKRPELKFRPVLKAYLDNQTMSGSANVLPLIFGDDRLQAMAFEELKIRPGFENFLKENAKFRVRLREAIPQLLFDFDPGRKPEDAGELRWLAENSRYLVNQVRLIDRSKPQEADISKFFTRARQQLRDLNPEKYDEVASDLDNYQLIKRYDRLMQEMKIS
jgi:hypothetical protein